MACFPSREARLLSHCGVLLGSDHPSIFHGTSGNVPLVLLTLLPSKYICHAIAELFSWVKGSLEVESSCGSAFGG